ncbi:37S ribosomal protein RSM18, mitochondrial [Fusarium austroafricanum]|uniref:Small ribosomal subunit protein bS18m n=1 Tax=Fusarium austroafricanum TaxID=2364996 RepID=A0A8H4NS61_9HYPO|nr:37S ribosomal protein RSM18, mitochondrial [Fusarium austroafricanum]
MPPRLPTSSTTSSIARRVIRSFSTTASAAAPGRHPPAGGHSNRLANLNNSNNNRGSGRGQTRGDAAARLLERYKSRTNSYSMEKTAQMEFLRNQKMSNDFLKQMPRRWEAGDVYSPHDLSPVEMQKWRKRTVRNNDVIDALGISPLDMYKNFSLIEHFTSSSGMINHSNLTRLRPANQRKVAKMVRRVQGMGIYPSVHAHPEMLRDHFFSRHK